MSIRLETIEAESRNSSNNNKNKHQWLLRKCLRIRSSPQKKKKKKKKIPFLNSMNFVVRRRLFTYVVMWVVQDRERASSHTFGCHFWTTSSLWWNYKVHSSLSLFVCLFFGPTSVFVFVLFTVFTMSLFRMFYTLYTKMNLDLFFFFFSKVVHQLCMPICTACVDHQELQGYFHEFS